jgi:hypothetical protein
VNRANILPLCSGSSNYSRKTERQFSKLSYRLVGRAEEIQGKVCDINSEDSPEYISGFAYLTLLEISSSYLFWSELSVKRANHTTEPFGSQ